MRALFNHVNMIVVIVVVGQHKIDSFTYDFEEKTECELKLPRAIQTSSTGVQEKRKNSFVGLGNFDRERLSFACVFVRIRH